MFRGVSQLSLDIKGRVVMPTRYRQALEDSCSGQMVVTVDTDQCLLLYPVPEWEIIESKLAALPSLNKQARKLQRLLIGHATEVEMDKAGRLLIPPPLRGFAKMDKQVVLIGQGKKFELWDEATWNELRDVWMNEEIDVEAMPADMESLSF